MGTTPASYDYVIFHQPNPKFPTRAMADLGFKPTQWKTGLLVPEIGNTYAGAAIIGLAAVLDEAQPGQRILMVSYGSGAGSDAFDLLVTEKLAGAQKRAPVTRLHPAPRRNRLRPICACGAIGESLSIDCTPYIKRCQANSPASFYVWRAISFMLVWETVTVSHTSIKIFPTLSHKYPTFIPQNCVGTCGIMQGNVCETRGWFHSIYSLCFLTKQRIMLIIELQSAGTADNWDPEIQVN
ncbi:MAG: 3-oxoacyl-[acyl-carrier-protein] synthase III C-terminal domain-containing protein [Caldilineaceae bacterium]